MKVASKTVTNRLLELSSPSISSSKTVRTDVKKVNTMLPLLVRCFNDIGNLGFKIRNAFPSKFRQDWLEMKKKLRNSYWTVIVTF